MGSTSTSAGRALLLRAPLDENGAIDGSAIGLDPTLATVRRFWGSEPDRFGHIERADGHWMLRWSDNREASPLAIPVSARIQLGSQVDINEPDGTTKAFRVTSINSVARPPTT